MRKEGVSAPSMYMHNAICMYIDGAACVRVVDVYR